jgi:tripartite-type tricarboxylate transporter receptor subunit TctC
MRNRASALAVALISVVLLSAQPAGAQTYPAQPLAIICPYTPGSSMDILARMIVDEGVKYFGQPMVVINKPGASGSVAAADVISSRPDGYKVLMASNVLFATTVKTQKVPFDPNDLSPLVNFMSFRHGLLVKGDSPHKTLDDLLAYGKKNPEQLRWGHSGRGLPLHINGLLIFKRAGVKTLDIPYKGSPECFAALLGNHIDAASIVAGTITDQVRAGQARYLVFFSERRYSSQPTVPTTLELGYPDATLPSHVGLYIHKNTPEAIMKTLLAVFKRISEAPEIKRGIEKIGEEPRPAGPDWMYAAIKKSEEIGVPILKELGLYVGK